MSQLWNEFVNELLRKGYSTNDLTFCTEDIFRNLARECGFTSPKVLGQLVQYWKHWCEKARIARGEHNIAKEDTLSRKSLQMPELTQYKVHEICHMAQELLQRHVPVSSQKRIVVAETHVQPISAWTSSHANTVLNRFANVVARLANNEIKLLWKLCSPVTIAELEQKLNIDNANDTDSLCSSGIVLYDALKPVTRLGILYDDNTTINVFSSTTPFTRLQELIQSGWGLVAFDVAPGLSRVIHSTELDELRSSFYRFTMSECLAMLQDAHFDSFVIPAIGATIVCQSEQLLPRYVVYFTVETHVAAAAAPPHNIFTHAPVMPMSEVLETIPSQPNNVINHQSQEREENKSVVNNGWHTDNCLNESQVSEIKTNVRGKKLHNNVNNYEKTNDDKYHTQNSRIMNKNDIAGITVTTTPTTTIENSKLDYNATPVMCTVHPHKSVEFWSPTEQRLLCSLCLYFDGYSRQNCIPIDQAVREQIPKLQRWMQNACTFQHEVSGVFELFEAAIDDVVTNEESTIKNIHEQFHTVHTQLEELESKLCNECHSRSVKQQQQIQLASDEVRATVQDVDELVRYIDKPLSTYKELLVNNVNKDVDANTKRKDVRRIEHTTIYAQLLQGAQSIFRKWTQVKLPSYSLLRRQEGILSSMQDAIRKVAVSSHVNEICKGNVELPDAIDINSLHDNL